MGAFYKNLRMPLEHRFGLVVGLISGSLVKRVRCCGCQMEVINPSRELLPQHLCRLEWAGRKLISMLHMGLPSRLWTYQQKENFADRNRLCFMTIDRCMRMNKTTSGSATDSELITGDMTLPPDGLWIFHHVSGWTALGFSLGALTTSGC